MFGCRACDFDVCAKCFANGGPPADAQLERSASAEEPPAAELAEAEAGSKARRSDSERAEAAMKNLHAMRAGGQRLNAADILKNVMTVMEEDEADYGREILAFQSIIAGLEGGD